MHDPGPKFVPEPVAVSKPLPSGFDAGKKRRDDNLVALVQGSVAVKETQRGAPLAEAALGAGRRVRTCTGHRCSRRSG